MPKYIVKDSHKHHDGKSYAPGDVMECTEEVGRQLRLEPVKEPHSNPPRKQGRE